MPSADYDALGALVIHPGDSVLVALRRDGLSAEQAVMMRDQLSERFPGVTFTIIGGVAALARVLPPEMGQS